MKVLHIVEIITNNSLPELNKKSSGYGFMVNDIIESINTLSKISCDVFILKCPFLRIAGDKYQRLRFRNILNLIRYGNLSILLELIRKYGRNPKNLRDIIYYYIICYSSITIIKSNNYDLIHIHGCGFYDRYIYDICKRLKKKMLITLHGLNSFGGVNINELQIKFERDFLRFSYKKMIPVSLVSSGCRRTVCNYLNINENSEFNNFHVVCNGTKIQKNKKKLSIDYLRDFYNIEKDEKILLYIGNININKNQIGFCDGFKNFIDNNHEKVKVLFLGRNDLGNSLLEHLSTLGIARQVILCGNVPKDLVPEYIEQSDGVCLISYKEGFGLSLIESLSAGKPCMFVKDMDAADDIFNDSCCVLIPDRSPNSISKGLKILLNNQWDDSQIIDYSDKFSLENMAIRYIMLYKNILHE